MAVSGLIKCKIANLAFMCIILASLIYNRSVCYGNENRISEIEQSILDSHKDELLKEEILREQTLLTESEHLLTIAEAMEDIIEINRLKSEVEQHLTNIRLLEFELLPNIREMQTDKNDALSVIEAPQWWDTYSRNLLINVH